MQLGGSVLDKSEQPAFAAILVESHSELVIGEIELPKKLGYGQVLVLVRYSGICASQVHEIDALKGPDAYLPHLLGHEGSGSVLGIGPGVTTVSPGDNVVMHWRPGAGIQSETPKYRWDGQAINAGSVTTFNSHAIVSENRVTWIPEGFDMRLAPLLGCAITTAFGAIGNDAKLKVGESIVVLGAGGVGLAAVHAAHLTSAFPIVAIDLFDGKLAAALDVGATHTLDGGVADSVLERIYDIVGSEGADVVIETTGVSSVIELAYAASSSRGRTILVGVPDVRKTVTLHTLPLHFGKVLTGSHGGSSEPDRDIPRLVRLVDSGTLDLGRFPVTEHALADINDAVRLLRAGSVGRQLIRMP
jgi:S-(hydroxymethyl)glutathione dehydrogenase/alcohol dehydrogenase